MNKKTQKILIKVAYFLATTTGVFTLVMLGSNSGHNLTLLYTTSSISVVMALFLASTQGLFNKYTKSVLSFLFLIVFSIVVDLFSCQSSIMPILFIFSATVSLLTFYGIESDREKDDGAALKQEVDDRPFIISKASDFEIKEEDFPVDESSDDQSSTEE